VKRLVLLVILVGFILCVVNFSYTQKRGFSYEELRELHQSFRNGSREIIDSSEYYLHSVECQGCHGFDPAGEAMVNLLGEDVNLFDDWQTSMMGLSAVDPFWRAKVSHEGLVNPAHASILENECTKCHAPMGHYTAFFRGQDYTIADLLTDSLGLDGVSCSGCHMIDSTVGTTFSGTIPYDTNNVEYGPFEDPVVGNMQLYVGIIPTYSTHVSEGRFCAPCHTLITNTVDLSGNPTGGIFVEQATFHEWQNSSYPSQNTSCQTCHMPQIKDPVILMVGNNGLDPRTPFNLHTFAGANVFMQKLIKNNKTQLGITASDANFDSTINETTRLLTQNSADVLIQGTPYASQDSLYINVEVKNKAGHKFPSGYPSRRVVVQLVVTKTITGDTIFKSGLFDQDAEVLGLSTPYEPHYEIIFQESQVQIYEMIMGDVNGDKTTVLERAASQLKDNRIPPLGFSTLHSSYDTMKIMGNAAYDPNFNLNGSVQGTGKDLVYYHIPLNGFNGKVNIYAKVFYQTLPPSWLSEMFSYNSTEIDAFRTMYQAADLTPILVSSDEIENLVLNIGVPDVTLINFNIWPNPTFDATIGIESPSSEIVNIRVFDLTGKKVDYDILNQNSSQTWIRLPERKGTYIVIVDTKSGSVTRKIINL
jgi:hypothetical protein